MYSLYILFSEDINKFYIGITNNLEGRLRRHLSANKGFTAQTKDWKIVYTEHFNTKSQALKRERQLKNWKNPKRIIELINRKYFPGVDRH